MATYEITSPDGSKYQITAPDDATPEAVQKYAMAMAPRANPDDNLPSDIECRGHGYFGIPLPAWASAGLVGAGKTFSCVSAKEPSKHITPSLAAIRRPLRHK